jgi:hypothetical protein
MSEPDPSQNSPPPKACCRRHLCPPARVLRRLAPGVVFLHRCYVRGQQDHSVAQEIYLRVVQAPVLTYRHHQPTVQRTFFLLRPVPGAARHPSALLRSQRRPKDR